MIIIDIEISRSKTVSTFRVKQPADCLPPLPATTLRSGEVQSRFIFLDLQKKHNLQECKNKCSGRSILAQ